MDALTSAAGAPSPQVGLSARSGERGRRVISVAGVLDAAAVFRLEHRLYGLRAYRKSDVVVDLTELTWIGASAMRALVGALRRLDRPDARVSVIAGSSRMSRSFELAGASGLLGSGSV